MADKNLLVRTRTINNCKLCGTKGDALYDKLTDRLFAASGEWSIYRCNNSACGLLWLNPCPVDDDLGLLYKNYYTHEHNYSQDSMLRRVYQFVIDNYLAFRFGYHISLGGFLGKLAGLTLYLHPGRRAEVETTVMHLRNVERGNLLEVGAGSGKTLHRLNSLGWEVQGIDFDPVAVEKARSLGLDVAIGDVFSQGYKSDQFDAVILSHVIEHVPEPVVLLKECRRILKPGGKLMISTPNTGSMGHKLFKNNWRGLEPPRHICIFNRSNLERAARDAGFEIAKVCAAGWGRNILFKSLALYLNNKENFNSFQRLFKLISGVLAYIEAMLVYFKPELSEQIMLSAEKSQSSGSRYSNKDESFE